jgi:uncharacterized SAM-binding protein YcdF (DUF218 family)
MVGVSYSFLMPPTILIALCPLAALLALRYPRLGMRLALAASVLLYLSAMPVFAQALARLLVTDAASEAALQDAQAIVVLGAGLHVGGAGGATDELDALSIERVTWAAELYRAMPLPIAVSGGRIEGSTSSLGALMKQQLEGIFGVPVTWTEELSRTTFENARNTAPLLTKIGRDRVIVVTHPWHMARALWSFKRVGIQAIPCPMPDAARKFTGFAGFLPNLGALQQTFYDLHELLGLAYYKLRY